jgi:uncharacterized protein (TIGR02284 family)
MTANNRHSINALNGLVETTLDSAEGYRVASEDTTNPRFKTLFAERAQSRRQIVAALQAEVRSLGGSPQDDGTVLGAAHRVFLNLKNLVDDSDQAIVNEVEAGEDHVKEKYEAVLADDELQRTAREAAHKAYASIKADHDRMRDLKRALKAA